jgi:sulfide:quinone oxidoreductase
VKKLVILGGGTAGTMMAAKLRERLDPWSWQIQVVDRDNQHLYQPGLLFLPFGVYGHRHLFKPRSRFMPDGVELVLAEVDRVDPFQKKVLLAGGDSLPYDQLILATGSRIVPEETPGLRGDGWGKDVFDFYTVEGAAGLRERLAGFKGGRLVINLLDMPIKCPVAPLEFAYLADWFFHERGVRDDVEIVYATSLDSAFTKPRSSEALGSLMTAKDIRIEPGIAVEEVDAKNRLLKSFDGRSVDYDLLVSIPLHRGSPLVARSGLGNEADFVPTDKHTLRSVEWEDIWVLGDATDLPSSKAGSVAHFQAEVLTENLAAAVAGLEPPASFDGHANCFIETGFGKAILIDFNYDTEPLPGRFPLPGAGPFTLLEESEANHWGKMAFRWAYWNLLLKGADMSSIGPSMSPAGKWS